MSTGSWPSLVDVASRRDPDGKIPIIAEMLSQCNEFEAELPWVEANEMGGHQFVFRTSIPAGAWRSYNMGVGYSKSTTAKARVDLGMLTDYSQVDRDLARHSGDVERFRETEDVAFLEGMSQTMTQAFFYGNNAINPAEFMGLSPFYNTINTNTAQNASNVLNGGGTGSSNTSLWLLGLGPDTIFGLFPRGSKAGLQMEDKGDIVPAYDALGNRFEAYTSYFQQEAGLCPKDWRWGVRLANVDVTAAGLAGPNAIDLFTTMDQMALLLPKSTGALSGITKTDAPEDNAVGVHIMFFCNRTMRHWMNVQAMRDRNVLLSLTDYAGRPVTKFRDIDIRVVDQLVNTESVVS